MASPVTLVSPEPGSCPRNHAGGPINGPSLALVRKNDTNRIINGRITGVLTQAVGGALGPDGILVCGSCGYYYSGSKAYQDQWSGYNLGGMAAALGVTVFASPGPALPNLQTGTEPFMAQGGDHAPFFGVAPNGTRITTGLRP